ncbi:putative conserved membrane protein [Synechococcus sp. A15-60]|nr:putative conserved membrane protein [Synechococcus sp. A15-60]
MTTTTTSEKKRPKRPRFWVGPLVAGACFALGYGITQRVVMLRQGQQDPQQASFQQSSFPGQSLDSLRSFYGADQPLMGDVTAKEARDAEKRQMLDEAEAIAAEAEQREEQQAALREPPSSLPAGDLSPQPAPVLPAAEETNAPDPGLPLSPTLEPGVQEPDAGFPAGPAQEAPVQADSGPPEVLPVSEPLRTPQPTFDPQNVLTPPMAPPNP